MLMRASNCGRAFRPARATYNRQMRVNVNRIAPVARAMTVNTAPRMAAVPTFVMPTFAKRTPTFFAQPARIPFNKVALRTPTTMRFYSAEVHKLSEAEITERVIEVVKGFPKVDTTKVKPDATFAELGIDSLDAVELMMAIEDNFVIEIPDAEIEKLKTIRDIISYISTHPHAK